jgi:acylphosphatase
MFRDFTRRNARRLMLVGTVENQEDGTVSIYAEGEKKNLETFVARLEKGPLLARVDAVDYAFVEPRGAFSTFSILYD